ncbi:MAG: hypothetical protein QW821_03925, partial [Candidatus Bathyarchaeia archaeon]
DNILRLILDGKWHDTAEIALALQISPQKVDKIIQLFREFNFIQHENFKIRISPDVRKLLVHLEEEL